MSPNDQLILKHYKKVAKNFGLSPLSTMRDQIIRNAEVQFVLTQIKSLIDQGHKIRRVLDIGCGNGHLIERIHEEYKDLELFGLEFTPELFEIAQKRNLERATFIQGDARKLNLKNMDIVVTERSLINLLTWNDQFKALSELSEALNNSGHYIMIESFKEPLDELNRARKEMRLEALPVSYQNRYFNKQLDPHLNKIGLYEVDGCMAKNHLSSHFYTTRVLHPVIRPQEGRIKDTIFSNFFYQAFPPAIGNFSPILFRVFEKK